MKRPCLEHGCPRLTERTRCPDHERGRDRARGTTTGRGYGAPHQAARAALAATLPRPCGYGCGTTLYPGDRWVAAHVRDGHPEYGYHVACPACNERAKQRVSDPWV